MIKLVTLKRVIVLVQDTLLGMGLGIVCGGFIGWLIYKFVSPLNSIVKIGIAIGGICGFILGIMAGRKFGKTVAAGRLQEWRRDVTVYGSTVFRIYSITGTLLGMTAGTLHLGNITGLIIGGIAGFLLAALITIPLGLTYMFTIGLLVDAPIIISFLLILRIGAKYNLFSNEEIAEIKAWRHYFRGIKYDKKERVQDAIREYNEAIELMPNFPEVYNNLGYDYGLIGKADEEIDAYEKALELKPDYVFAMENLVICYKQQGKQNEAWKWQQQLNELNPNK